MSSRSRQANRDRYDTQMMERRAIDQRAHAANTAASARRGVTPAATIPVATTPAATTPVAKTVAKGTSGGGGGSTPLADEIAKISREEFDRYLTEFRPLEQKTIASLDDSTVQKSMGAAQGDAVQARASLERMRERYGVSTTPAQAAGEARQNALSGALNTLSAGNTAAQFDKDNKQQTMAGLLNVGQGIRQQALGGFASAAGMESSRNSANQQNQAAYAQQKSASKASTYSSVASLGMMGAMMFM